MLGHVWVVSLEPRARFCRAVRTDSIHPCPTPAYIPPPTRRQVSDIPSLKPPVSPLFPLRAVTCFVEAASQQLVQDRITTYRYEFPSYCTPLDIRAPSQFIQFMAQQRRQQFMWTSFSCDGRCGWCIDRRCSSECTFV